MPYSIDHENKCVYKKKKVKKNGKMITVRGEKVGCTKGSLKDYVAALQIHAENKKPMKKIMKEQDELQEPVDGSISQIYVVQKPYAGCEMTSLVKPIDPLVGLGAYKLVPDQVHSIFADEPTAQKIATEIYEAHLEKETSLEEKKEVTTKKLKSTIDAIEKKRKEHMDMVKEDPKNASKHREQIAIITSKLDDLMTKLEKIEKSKKPIEEKLDEGFFDRLKASLKGTGAQASTTVGNFKAFLKGDKNAIKDPALAKNMTILQQKAKTLDKELSDVMRDISKLFPAETLEKAPAEFKTALSKYTSLLDQVKLLNNNIVTGNVSTTTTPLEKSKQETTKANKPTKTIDKKENTNNKAAEKTNNILPPEKASQLLLVKNGTAVMYKGLTYSIKKDEKGEYIMIDNKRYNINNSTKKKLNKK